MADPLRLTDLTPPLPLLITGVSGVAGYHAFFHFATRSPGQVVGVRPSATWQLTAPGVVALDTEDEPALTELFRRHRFAAVLNTTGNCALKSCELAPDMAHRTNVLSAIHVARAARAWGSRLVHLGSDLVFSGADRGGYVETDAPDPVTVYGKTMALAESAVAAIDPTAAILRISLPMGPSFNGHAGAVDWIQSRFRHHRPATLYFDEVRSAAYCDDLSRVFAWFLRSRVGGLYHLGGPRPITLFQIAQVVNKVGGYDPELLCGIPRREAGPMPPRAGDVSMDSSRLIALLGGNPLRPWPHADEWFPTDRGWHFDRPAGWPGSAAHLRRHLYTYPGADAALDEMLRHAAWRAGGKQFPEASR